MTRVSAPAQLDPSQPPVLIVPGYGMNSHALRFHQNGRSMKRAFAEAGREVWTVDLRQNGESRRFRSDAPPPCLTAYATVDLPTGIEAVLHHTRCRPDVVALVGVSLGGSISYGYLATHPEAPVQSLVAMGAPLRWGKVSPLLRAAFVSRRLAGAVPIGATRPLARFALPTLGRLTPWLDAYVNARRVRTSSVAELVKTVEDPPRSVNRQLAAWFKNGGLKIGGISVAERLGDVQIPLLVVTANGDGIVPAETAHSVLDVWGGPATILVVGDDEVRYGHADPYIAPDAHERVFSPIIDWVHSAG